MAEVVFQRIDSQTFIVHDQQCAESLPSMFVANVKKSRNPSFHRKVFAFFKFCFDHWASDREFMDERGQFEVFRNHLTVLAGYYDVYYSIKGDSRVEAKSLSYANMSEEEFQGCYVALINAAVRTIFPSCGKEVEQKLYSFF